MEKIEVPFNQAHARIREFYNVEKHHFIAMNGIDHGAEKLEVQWFFANYEIPGDVTMFATFTNFQDTIPSMGDFIKSAWVTECEFYDLFDVKVEGAKKGFVLEPDQQDNAPLRRKK
jgi:NADH:ubiquinone oxidoreductase subunit C